MLQAILANAIMKQAFRLRTRVTQSMEFNVSNAIAARADTNSPAEVIFTSYEARETLPFDSEVQRPFMKTYTLVC